MRGDLLTRRYSLPWKQSLWNCRGRDNCPNGAQMRTTHQAGETDNRKHFKSGQIAALASCVFLVCIFPSFIQPAGALTWTSANGCWTATNGNNYLVMWNASGVNSWTAPSDRMNLSVLVVAGGGGGGSSTATSTAAGGGGAGEVINVTSYTVSGVLNVTVGGDGSGGSSTGLNYGKNGLNSVFGTITALGGGGGAAGTSPAAGVAGGSGGGGADSGSGGTASPGSIPGGGTDNENPGGGWYLFKWWRRWWSRCICNWWNRR